MEWNGGPYFFGRNKMGFTGVICFIPKYVEFSPPIYNCNKATVGYPWNSLTLFSSQIHSSTNLRTWWRNQHLSSLRSLCLLPWRPRGTQGRFFEDIYTILTKVSGKLVNMSPIYGTYKRLKKGKGIIIHLRNTMNNGHPSMPDFC